MTTQTAEQETLFSIVNELNAESIGKLVSYAAFLRFEENDGDFYNPVNIARIKHSIEQANRGEFVIKTMEELGRMADE
ncbi:MAG: hypothetical protein LBG12_09755 [Synergistaceae bacterium]|jgi:hypothetical protein|nr:hypothetical protein [Synergistaceae bacterium]